MVHVLIPTKSDDSHAVYVQLALERKGHSATRWYTADFPTQQTHTFEFSNKEVSWNAQGVDLSINHNSHDVVWLRRAKQPILSDAIHPADRDNVHNENRVFYHALWHVIAPQAKWVNPSEGMRRANSKLLQLQLAASVGLKTPHTLVSNNPEKIKAFIKYHRKSDVIYKALHPMFWFEGKSIRLAYTKEIDLSDLPSDETLQLMPGIFQQKIKKAYELRVTYCGDFPVAVKLRSQENPRGIMDWRHIPPNELIVEEYALPPQVDYLCREFMRRLGIVFGCFDFIVTPDNEYYFLEVNEQGQFLWVEEINPDIKILDIFTEFLIHQDEKFKWKKSSSTVSLEQFESIAEPLAQKSIKLHKNNDSSRRLINAC